MSALKWLWKYVRNYRFLIPFIILLTVIVVASAFATPLLLGQIVDKIIMGKDKTRLIWYCTAIIGFTALKELIMYIRHILLENMSQGAIKLIRNTLYKKLQELDLSYFDNTRKGDIMSRLTMDTDAIRIITSMTIPSIIEQAFYVIIGLGIMFPTSPLLTVMLISSTPFIAISAYKLSKYIKFDYMKLRESNASLNTVVAENISGNRVVKAYAREEYEIEKFEEKNEEYKNAFMCHVVTWAKYAPNMFFFVNMTHVIFILVGGLLVLSHNITVGEFTVFNGCLWCIIAPMMTIGNFINQFRQFNASTAKIRQLENEESKIQNHDIEKSNTRLTGKIEFRNVSFAYNGDRVLKNINFSANAGDTVAIVGPTGSGKTTLINLLSRFYDPTAGTIYIDDTNIKNIEIKTLHQNISSAMQDVFLFSDTIRNNIAYGKPDATFDEVKKVAMLASADDFITETDEGYDTMVGERGTGLSGGQKQRISLARALLKNPAILILDDTTSALDMETEYIIQENLKQSKQTKIIIAHRISSVKNADLILVLNQGNLVEWGTHDALMAQNGYYKGVFDHQFGDFNKAPSYHINHPASNFEAHYNGGEK